MPSEPLPNPPTGCSLDPTKPSYVLKWLVLADRLQLDALRACCLKGLKAFPPAELSAALRQPAPWALLSDAPAPLVMAIVDTAVQEAKRPRTA
jgi:hypothetical protein